MTAQCLVWSMLLDGEGGGREIDETALARVEPEDGLLWLHVEYGQPDARDFLREQSLDEEIVELLTVTETRPRSLLLHGGCYACLRGVNTNPGADPEDMVSIRVWLEPGRIVTARQRRLLTTQDMRNDLLAGRGPLSSGGFLVELTERLANRIGMVVDGIEERIEQQEEGLDTLQLRQARLTLLDTRREAAVIRRFLGPMRDALSALYRASTEVLSESDVRHVRDQADRIARYVEDLDLVRERAAMIQEELQNRLAEQQNARTYVLSIVAAIFLPLSFLTGVFGMNVAGLPGTEAPDAFLVLSVFMTGLAIAVFVWLRWKRWI